MSCQRQNAWSAKNACINKCNRVIRWNNIMRFLFYKKQSLAAVDNCLLLYTSIYLQEFSFFFLFFISLSASLSTWMSDFFVFFDFHSYSESYCQCHSQSHLNQYLLFLIQLCKKFRIYLHICIFWNKFFKSRWSHMIYKRGVLKTFAKLKRKQLC